MEKQTYLGVKRVEAYPEERDGKSPVMPSSIPMAIKAGPLRRSLKTPTSLSNAPTS